MNTQEEFNIRRRLTSEQRSLQLVHTIDPGFVHYRKIQTIIGQANMKIVDQMINDLPDMRDHLKELRIDHIYTRALLALCNKMSIKPLQEILASREGTLFCSTERLKACPHIFTQGRAISIWDGDCPQQVEFHYSTSRVKSDTLKSKLHDGSILSIIAILASVDQKRIIFEPLVIGFPWLAKGDSRPDFDIMWLGYHYYQNFIEDFDEFSLVKNLPDQENPEPMRNITENAFKICLAEILGDSVPKDWGGERSDYFTAHIHLKGKRFNAAFLLKGPHKFSPMKLTHLGKNADQIVRLSHEPADILFVQHCHDITPPVRETLRAFAVQPSNPRRYCLIDGRDSLQILKAYGKYEKAISLSEKCKG